MKTLDDEVRLVVQDFMKNGELFTALDVSNKVKMSLPFARHREVRDLVRSMFVSDIESQGWSRTPITVTLSDGTTTEALLYHSLSDSWDLDSKYDLQKRNQGTVQNTVSVNSTPVSVPKTSGAVVLGLPQSQPPTVSQASVKDRWLQLFDTQPSLFPVK